MLLTGTPGGEREEQFTRDGFMSFVPLSNVNSPNCLKAPSMSSSRHARLNASEPCVVVVVVLRLSAACVDEVVMWESPRIINVPACTASVSVVPCSDRWPRLIIPNASCDSLSSHFWVTLSLLVSIACCCLPHLVLLCELCVACS